MTKYRSSIAGLIVDGGMPHTPPMTSRNAPGPSKPHRLRPLAEELGVLLFIGLAAIAPDLIADAFGSPTVARLVGLVLIAAPFACLWGFAKLDPAGFVSIAGPVEVLGAIAFVTAWYLPGYVGAILFLAWAIAGSRIWPRWSREVLRRMRPGTPEAEVVTASRRIFALWRSPMTQEAYATITKEIQDLDRLSTPRTIAYISGLQAAWDFRPESAADDRGKRISARLAEEYDRLWRGPQISLRGGNRALAFRPSRGTRLEFRFPHLEALVAIGTAAEQSEMAGRAAGRALHDVGIASPELDGALREVAAGHEQPEARREVDEQLQTVLDELLPMYDHPDPDADERGLQLAREANALSSAQSALAPDLSPRDAANAIYSAIAADLTNEDESAYEALLTEIVGKDRAAKAVAVEPIARRMTDGQDAESGSFVGPMLALIARSSATRRGLGCPCWGWDRRRGPRHMHPPGPSAVV
jgi:hypothetical protein